MGGKSKTQKTTQESSPWAPQVAPLKHAFSEARRLYDSQGPSYFPGATVAGFNNDQEQAFDMTRARATGGNQTMRAAEGYARDVLGGRYSGNPLEGQVFQNIQQRVMPAVNSQFMGSGRYGSGMHADTAARGMTEAFAPVAASMYEQGMNRMDNAARMAPMFAQNDYADIEALMRMGQQQQGQSQAEIDADKAKWDYEQALPYNKLGQFLNNIGGNYGGTVVGTTKVPQPSMFSQIAGAGLGLLGGLGGLGWNPFGSRSPSQ